MTWLTRDVGSFSWKALALALGICTFSDSSALADGEMMMAPVGPPPPLPKGVKGPHGYKALSTGTLGYGAPGLYPGFAGFGLGYHLGYGYGGRGLGVGAEGGYPFYGGPGYPHPEPSLRRIGGINPFPHYAGPGYPTPEHPQYFGAIGGLVADPPVVKIGDEVSDTTGYGASTGMLPYPEAHFAPFTARAAAEGISNGASSSPSYPAPGMNSAPTPSPAGSGMPTDESPKATPPDDSLGIEAEPVEEGGLRGLKISKVIPGTAAERAGLHTGDVIRTANGYLTEQPGNLVWIIANASPGKVLTMTVRNASDGKDLTAKAQLR